MINKFRANRAPALLTRLAQMFFRLQTNEKTTLCYSAYSRFDSKMETFGISKSQICAVLIQHPRLKSFRVIGGFFKIPLNLFLTIFSPINPNLFISNYILHNLTCKNKTCNGRHERARCGGGATCGALLLRALNFVGSEGDFF